MRRKRKEMCMWEIYGNTRNLVGRVWLSLLYNKRNLVGRVLLSVLGRLLRKCDKLSYKWCLTTKKTKTFERQDIVCWGENPLHFTSLRSVPPTCPLITYIRTSQRPLFLPVFWDLGLFKKKNWDYSPDNNPDGCVCVDLSLSIQTDCVCESVCVREN